MCRPDPRRAATRIARRPRKDGGGQAPTASAACRLDYPARGRRTTSVSAIHAEGMKCLHDECQGCGQRSHPDSRRRMDRACRLSRQRTTASAHRLPDRTDRAGLRRRCRPDGRTGDASRQRRWRSAAVDRGRRTPRTGDVEIRRSGAGSASGREHPRALLAIRRSATGSKLSVWASSTVPSHSRPSNSRWTFRGGARARLQGSARG